MNVNLPDIDGNNQKCLTYGDIEDNLPFYSPDPQWIYFISYRDTGKCNLWKVPANGGEPVKAFEDIIEGRRMGFSPDGSSVIIRFLQTSDNGWHWGIFSLYDGKHKKVFDLPSTASARRLCWMPDGKGISYIDTRHGVSNIWVLPLETMKAYQFTYFESEQISDYAWSKDGKDLAIIRG